MNPNSPLAERHALHLADLKGQSVVSSGSFDSFLSACQGPSLEQLAQVGVDCSKVSPSFEGALDHDPDGHGHVHRSLSGQRS